MDSTTFVQVMQEIGTAGLSQTEVARAVGASPRTVQTWAAGSNQPRGVRAQRLLDVRLMVQKLGDIYTAEGIRIWLHSRNEHLGLTRPIDRLSQGDVDEVLREVESLHGGW
ncbi:hypothetical protein VV01_01255 [Luteipulveratus halotolerans]|uniref:Antitoxin Xre/MbcA/ParS-like toxin-binding domain-containing protein n=1 Tax=Luteipulveratus halotolerans TaxID=1631356 RepID=A0A0L6CE55_9MICO|nr:hypothetical protein VV01_01255 [Luteipulveratus halotolerans]